MRNHHVEAMVRPLGLDGSLHSQRLLFEHDFKGGLVSGLTAGWEAGLQVGFFWDARGFTSQPVGVELHFEFGGGLETRCHFDGHHQQDLTFKSIVGEITHSELLRERPLNGAGLHALGQFPSKAGWQAGVTGVDPVGVPTWLVGELHAQVKNCVGGNAMGCMNEQLRIDLTVCGRCAQRRYRLEVNRLRLTADECAQQKWQ